jgi:hypothetical protein
LTQLPDDSLHVRSRRRIADAVRGAAYLASMARLVGRWRMVEMDLWDRDAIDLLGPAFIEFRPDSTGSFRFIAVEGYLDCRHDERVANA